MVNRIVQQEIIRDKNAVLFTFSRDYAIRHLIASIIAEVSLSNHIDSVGFDRVNSSIFVFVTEKDDHEFNAVVQWLQEIFRNYDLVIS